MACHAENHLIPVFGHWISSSLFYFFHCYLVEIKSKVKTFSELSSTYFHTSSTPPSCSIHRWFRNKLHLLFNIAFYLPWAIGQLLLSPTHGEFPPLNPVRTIMNVLHWPKSSLSINRTNLKDLVFRRFLLRLVLSHQAYLFMRYFPQFSPAGSKCRFDFPFTVPVVSLLDNSLQIICYGFLCENSS